METETIDKLFLELCQFTNAKSPAEAKLERLARDLMIALEGWLPEVKPNSYLDAYGAMLKEIVRRNSGERFVPA